MKFQKSQLHSFLRIVKLFYTPLCFFFILYFAWINRILLNHLFDFTNFYLLIVSAVIWGALHFLAPLGPKLVFESLGVTTKYKQLLVIHVSRLPARYLPGGIWHTVGRITDYRSLGISKKALTFLVIVETFFPCFITFILGGGYLWLSRKTGLLSNIEGILAGLSLCATVLIPVIILRKFKSHIKDNFLSLYIFLLLTTVVFWLIASISFLFYYSSVSSTSSQISLFNIAATYIFSWGVGYISVFAPQGIGVFEVVAGKLMELPMSLGGAVAFLAGFRIVALGGDSLAWSVCKAFPGLFHSETMEETK